MASFYGTTHAASNRVIEGVRIGVSRVRPISWPALAIVVAACTSAPAAALPTRPPTAGEPTVAASPSARAAPAPRFWVEAPIAGDPSPILARLAATGAVVDGTTVRLLPPVVSDGPRRVGIQAGHWRTEEAPPEFPSLRTAYGGSIRGVNEVDVTLDVARRVVTLLEGRGIIADLLPATVPPSYIADAFVSLHADGDVTGTASGFKIAHGFYRSPHDELLVQELTEHYGAASGLPWDPNVTGEMTDYYAFAWFRYEHALAPHTPAAIVEMGFISHAQDRALLVDHADVVAGGIAEGILRFLAATPRREIFTGDIVVPTVPGT